MSNPTELPDLDALLAEHSSAVINYAEHGDIGSYYNDLVSAENAIREMVARRAQPEGEAPQAEKRNCRKTDGGWKCLNCGKSLAVHENQLYCPAARHAESGAQAVLAEQAATMMIQRKKIQALEAALAAQSQGAQAKRLTEAECEDIAVTHAMSGSRRGSYYQFDKEGLDAFALDIMGRTSAPGTPEAPSDTERMDWLDQNIFHRGMDDLDAMRRKETWMWVTFAPKGVQGTARSIIDAARAAQLDGGQGEAG